jgi:hypothetical protein
VLGLVAEDTRRFASLIIGLFKRDATMRNAPPP